MVQASERDTTITGAAHAAELHTSRRTRCQVHGPGTIRQGAGVFYEVPAESVEILRQSPAPQTPSLVRPDANLTRRM
jgi:hypothetical protein